MVALRAPRGGTRIGGKWYGGGQMLPDKYRRLDEKATRPRDPASGMPSVAPNMERSTLPHLMRFSGMIQTLSRSYRHADEALMDSVRNAHMMLNDPMITEPLFQRMRKSALLEWHIEVPDENEPEQKALKKELTRLVEAVPRFTDYRFDLLLAIWFGRYAIEHTYQLTRTAPTKKAPRGYRRYAIKNWTPVDGDKLLFRYDDGRGDYDPEQIGIRVSPALAPKDLIAGERRLEATADGLGYFLEPWEQRFWTVHKHLLIDGHWEDPITAGRIHGVGLRSFVYWLWIQKQEALAQLSEIVEMSASGIWIYWYPAGNMKAHDEVEKVAAERIHTNVILMPRDPELETYGIEHIPFDGSGAQVLKELINDTYAHLIKRLILGQTLSSEADATGMGSGLADLQGETMADIIRFDAKKLEETITNGLLIELRDRNFPAQRHVDAKFRLDVDAEEPEKALDAIERAWNMGAKIAEKELMEKAGITPPKPGDEVLQNPVIMQQMRLAEQHLAGQGGGDMGQGEDIMGQLMGDAGGDGAEEGMPAEGMPGEEEAMPFAEGAGAQQGPEMYGAHGLRLGEPIRMAKQPKSGPGQGGLFDEQKHPRKPEGEGGGQFTGQGGVDTAVVNVPISKRGNIDAEIDRHKSDEAAAAKRDRKTKAATNREQKAEARALFEEFGEGLIERTVAKHPDRTPKQLRDHIDQLVKWEPAKAIALFEKEQKQLADTPEQPAGETLDDKILAALAKSTGSSLSDLAKSVGEKQGGGGDPLKSPLNQALVRLRDAGKLTATEPRFGEPSFSLPKPKKTPTLGGDRGKQFGRGELLTLDDPDMKGEQFKYIAPLEGTDNLHRIAGEDGFEFTASTKEIQPVKNRKPDFSYRYFRRGSYNVTPADDGLVISQE